jgi:hypothetical protein
VLDQIHHQSASLSHSMISAQAPESVDNSLFFSEPELDDVVCFRFKLLMYGSRMRTYV